MLKSKYRVFSCLYVLSSYFDLLSEPHGLFCMVSIYGLHTCIRTMWAEPGVWSLEVYTMIFVLSDWTIWFVHGVFFYRLELCDRTMGLFHGVLYLCFRTIWLNRMVYPCGFPSYTWAVWFNHEFYPQISDHYISTWEIFCATYILGSPI